MKARSVARKLRLKAVDRYWRIVGPVAHRQYARYYDHDSRWKSATWLGTQCLKLPADLFIYQELLCEIRPALVIETGTYRGGSALFFASVMDLLDCGEVVTVELRPRENLPEHPRIEYVTGSSTDPTVVAHVRARAEAAGGPIMVVLDSYHACDHVLDELDAYADLVGSGSYLIVEDTVNGGHPIKKHPPWGSGPWDALMVWLPKHPEFETDVGREKFVHTLNPNGYLRRV